MKNRRLIYAVLAVLGAAFVALEPNLALGYLKYTAALAVNRMVASFVAVSDQLPGSVTIAGGLTWNALIGYWCCTRSSTKRSGGRTPSRFRAVNALRRHSVIARLWLAIISWPLVRRLTRLSAWFGGKFQHLSAWLACQPRWVRIAFRVVLPVFQLAIVVSMVLVPSGALFGAELVRRFWAFRWQIQTAIISVIYTAGCQLYQQGASQVMGQPTGFMRLTPWVVLAGFVIWMAFRHRSTLISQLQALRHILVSRLHPAWT